MKPTTSFIDSQLSPQIPEDAIKSWTARGSYKECFESMPFRWCWLGKRLAIQNAIHAKLSHSLWACREGRSREIRHLTKSMCGFVYGPVSRRQAKKRAALARRCKNVAVITNGDEVFTWGLLWPFCWVNPLKAGHVMERVPSKMRELGMYSNSQPSAELSKPKL